MIKVGSIVRVGRGNIAWKVDELVTYGEQQVARMHRLDRNDVNTSRSVAHLAELTPEDLARRDAELKLKNVQL